MSTKIYNGFQFKDKDIFTINKNIQDFRCILNEFIASEYGKILANIAINKFDLICCKLSDKIDSSLYMFAIDTIEKEITKFNLPENKYYKHFLDYSTSITIHPYKNNFYGILFTDKTSIEKIWIKQKYIKDYSYWDNSDRPKGISNKKWHERGEIWNKILKDFHYVPALNGFTAELTKEMFYYK